MGFVLVGVSRLMLSAVRGLGLKFILITIKYRKWKDQNAYGSYKLL